MTTGETLLKITDIPFSYSLLAIVMGVMGVRFEGVNLAILIGTAGVLGTFLAVTDPVGRLLQSTLKRGIHQLSEKSELEDDVKWNFATSAIKTRAIGIEIDKFVSMFYLGLILLVFSSSVTYFPDFAENLQLYGDDKKIICDMGCAGILGVIFAGIAGLFQSCGYPGLSWATVGGKRVFGLRAGLCCQRIQGSRPDDLTLS